MCFVVTDLLWNQLSFFALKQLKTFIISNKFRICLCTSYNCHQIALASYIRPERNRQCSFRVLRIVALLCFFSTNVGKHEKRENMLVAVISRRLARCASSMLRVHAVSVLMYYDFYFISDYVHIPLPSSSPINFAHSRSQIDNSSSRRTSAS